MLSFTINLLRIVFDDLKIDDFEILEGYDGIDLLNMVRSDKDNKNRLIFIDENMEYLNGSQAVSIVRNLEQNKKIKKYEIISITAFDDKATQDRILGSGVNSILLKPCNKSDIRKILVNI